MVVTKWFGNRDLQLLGLKFSLLNSTTIYCTFTDKSGLGLPNEKGPKPLKKCASRSSCHVSTRAPSRSAVPLIRLIEFPKVPFLWSRYTSTAAECTWQRCSDGRALVKSQWEKANVEGTCPRMKISYGRVHTWLYFGVRELRVSLGTMIPAWLVRPLPPARSAPMGPHAIYVPQTRPFTTQVPDVLDVCPPTLINYAFSGEFGSDGVIANHPRRSCLWAHGNREDVGNFLINPPYFYPNLQHPSLYPYSRS